MKIKNYKSPFRVGRKQKLAILDSSGLFIVKFETGSELLALDFCEFLNEKYKENELIFRLK